MVTLENYVRSAMHPTTYELNDLFTCNKSISCNLFERYVSNNSFIIHYNEHQVLSLFLWQKSSRELQEITKYVGKFKYLKKMQMNPNQVPAAEEEVDEESKKHEYNCQCAKCSDKYGNLPLLVKVIEESETGQSKSDKDTKDTYDINQPSTSGTSKSKKEITCDVCDKKFTHKGDFNKHLRTHTGEQPYNCNVCFKKFSHASNLSRHLKLHSGDKPFECNICNKKFSRKDKLISHKKSRYCRKKSE